MTLISWRSRKRGMPKGSAGNAALSALLCRKASHIGLRALKRGKNVTQNDLLIDAIERYLSAEGV